MKLTGRGHDIDIEMNPTQVGAVPDWFESEQGLTHGAISRLLNLQSPWVTAGLEALHDADVVQVKIDHGGSEGLMCPQCG